MDAGRYFLHEHPAYASSWSVTSIKELLDDDKVDVVFGDQCQYGQATQDGEYEYVFYIGCPPCASAVASPNVCPPSTPYGTTISITTHTERDGELREPENTKQVRPKLLVPAVEPNHGLTSSSSS